MLFVSNGHDGHLPRNLVHLIEDPVSATPHFPGSHRVVAELLTVLRFRRRLMQKLSPNLRGDDLSFKRDVVVQVCFRILGQINLIFGHRVASSLGTRQPALLG